MSRNEFFQLERSGPATILTVQVSRISESEGIEQFFATLNALVQEGHKQLVLDLHQVQLVSSRALGKLVVFQRRLEQAGGWIRLCRLSDYLQELFRITQLGKLFQVFPDRDQALQNAPPAETQTLAPDNPAS